jgi:hypothetical protein
MAHTKPPRSPRRALRKWSGDFVALWLRITTSSNLAFLRKFWKGWHVSQENQKSYVSRRGAEMQGRKDGCGSLIPAPPRLCARRFWLRPNEVRPRWDLRGFRSLVAAEGRPKVASSFTLSKRKRRGKPQRTGPRREFRNSKHEVRDKYRIPMPCGRSDVVAPGSVFEIRVLRMGACFAPACAARASAATKNTC